MRRSCSQVAFLAAKIKAIYSALVDDSTIIDCRFEHQLIGPPFNMNIKPKFDFQLSLLPV